MEKIQSKAENKWVILLIAIFHIIGLLGLLLPAYQSAFIYFVPFSLLFLLGLLFYINIPARRSFIIFTLGVLICAFLAEVFGVHAQMLGKYRFGETLGLKLAAVPLMMGIYFVLLIYSVGQLIYLFAVRNTFLRCLIGSCFMLVFDYFLEPAAHTLNYWKWQDNQVPYQNYIAWFVISFVLLQFFYAMHLPVKKKTGLALYSAQLVLFIVLYLAAL